MPADRPLRIALLAHSTNPRGGVVHALELGSALADSGHRVTVLAPDAAGAGFFRQARCECIGVPAAPAPAGLRQLVEQRIGEYIAFFEASGTSRFDVFHAQDGISGNALATLAERRLIGGFVRTVHHLDTFADARLMALQRRSITAADAVLCVSRLWQDVLARDHGIAALPVTNGVDVGRFAPCPGEADARVRRRYGLRPGGPLVLAVGGIEARKNPLRLLEAWLELRRERPRAQLVIAGGASLLDHSACRAEFDARVAASGVETGPGKALVLTGPVPDDDMPALYRSADVLGFPSLREGFGLAVLEAMACGTPVAVSRSAPFTEYLGEDDCAWADPLDAASIAQALRRACEPATAAGLRRRGAAVAARFTWSASAARHLTIYADTLRSGAPRAGGVRPCRTEGCSGARGALHA